MTGASGFIGRYLVKELKSRGLPVRALIHKQPPVFSDGIELVEGDIRSPEAMQQAVKGCDTIFHLAGKVHALSDIEDNESEYQSLNVDGVRNLLEAGLKNGIKKFIFFSSVKAMGEKTAGCTNESHIPHPLSAYGRSKLEAEQMILDFGKRWSIHTTCLRLPMVYGIHNKGNILRMISAIDRGYFPPLPKSLGRRSMVHVANVVEAALTTVTNPKANGQCYIVSDPKPYTSREIYEMVCRIIGKPIPRWHIPLAAMKLLGWFGDGIGTIRGKRFFFDSDALEKLTTEAWYSSEKITRELGYQAFISFSDALPELVAWHQKTLKNKN